MKCLYNTRLKRVRAFVIKGSQKARLTVFVEIGLYNEDCVMQRESEVFVSFLCCRLKVLARGAQSMGKGHR